MQDENFPLFFFHQSLICLNVTKSIMIYMLFRKKKLCYNNENMYSSELQYRKHLKCVVS